MLRVLVVLFGFWQGCLYPVPNPSRTPVRRLLLDGGAQCLAVVLSPTRAYTAGHCLAAGMIVDDRPVTGAWAGPDLAVLKGQFRGPYARIGGTVSQHMLVEGRGCRSLAQTRPVILSYYRPGEPAWGGLEIAFRGVVCPGDSGGALWAHGDLVGVITAYKTDDTELGFATLIPVDPTPDLDGFLK